MNSKNKQDGISLAHVYFESHLVDVPLKFWWIDNEISIHAVDVLAGS